MAGVGMAPCPPIRGVLGGLLSRRITLPTSQDQPASVKKTPKPVLEHIANFFKCNRNTEKESLSEKVCDRRAYMPKFTRHPKPKGHLKPKAVANSSKPKLEIVSCLEKLKRHIKSDKTRHSSEPLLVPADLGQSSTPDTVTSDQPKVFVLEGHNDDPIWFDHVRPEGAIDKSMRVFDIAKADVVLLTVGSVNDPLLTKRLSEIPDEESRVIVASRNFRLRGVPADRCTIVTANPSADFDGTSAIDTSTRVRLPVFPPSNFSIGIVANDPQTVLDWVNHRREIPETLQIGDHTITLISNHNPDHGSPVDGYIVIAEENYETIALPKEPLPIVGVYKDPDMDALKQLPGATRTHPLAVCLSDPVPALVKRIICRKLVEKKKLHRLSFDRAERSIDRSTITQSPMPTIRE
ncbi:unnamed protein product [Clonostachys byssicola]|uniref:Uncharacterized protein n=1 Tax=Clonostachys byssicola TaxID=160290 RepID=A0A9N9Y130_9HYPO|nr:unnamed protein product [Clonostachys byssicola]